MSNSEKAFSQVAVCRRQGGGGGGEREIEKGGSREKRSQRRDRLIRRLVGFCLTKVLKSPAVHTAANEQQLRIVK